MTTQLKHMPIVDMDHPSGSGRLLRYRFSNNFGASVISNNWINGGDKDLYELAVIKYTNNDLITKDNWNLTYDTPITNDVIGNLIWDEVENYLDQIEALSS